MSGNHDILNIDDDDISFDEIDLSEYLLHDELDDRYNVPISGASPDNTRSTDAISNEKSFRPSLNRIDAYIHHVPDNDDDDDDVIILDDNPHCSKQPETSSKLNSTDIGVDRQSLVNKIKEKMQNNINTILPPQASAPPGSVFTPPANLSTFSSRQTPAKPSVNGDSSQTGNKMTLQGWLSKNCSSVPQMVKANPNIPAASVNQPSDPHPLSSSSHNNYSTISTNSKPVLSTSHQMKMMGLTSNPGPTSVSVMDLKKMEGQPKISSLLSALKQATSSSSQQNQSSTANSKSNINNSSINKKTLGIKPFVTPANYAAAKSASLLSGGTHMNPNLYNSNHSNTNIESGLIGNSIKLTSSSSGGRLLPTSLLVPQTSNSSVHASSTERSGNEWSLSSILLERDKLFSSSANQVQKTEKDKEKERAKEERRNNMRMQLEEQRRRDIEREDAKRLQTKQEEEKKKEAFLLELERKRQQLREHETNEDLKSAPQSSDNTPRNAANGMAVSNAPLTTNSMQQQRTTMMEEISTEEVLKMKGASRLKHALLQQYAASANSNANMDPATLAAAKLLADQEQRKRAFEAAKHGADGLSEIAMTWDYFALASDQTNGNLDMACASMLHAFNYFDNPVFERNKARTVPLNFESAEEFESVFAPLVSLEACASIASDLNDRSSKLDIHAAHVVTERRINSWTELVLMFGQSVPHNNQFPFQPPTDLHPNDIVILLPLDFEPTGVLPAPEMVPLIDPSLCALSNRSLSDAIKIYQKIPPHIIGVVDGAGASSSTVQQAVDNIKGGRIDDSKLMRQMFSIRSLSNVPPVSGRIPVSLVGLQSRWWIAKLSSLTTAIREYEAVFFTRFSPLANRIFMPSKFTASANKIVDAACEFAEKSSENLKSEVRIVARTANLNTWQTASLQTVRELTNGVVALQGPPGTGKTQTILSVIALELTRARILLMSRLMQKGGESLVKSQTPESINSFRPERSNKPSGDHPEAGRTTKKGGLPDMRPFKIVICAPSNAAVDELASRVLNGQGQAAFEDCFEATLRQKWTELGFQGVYTREGLGSWFSKPKCLRLGSVDKITKEEVKSISLRIRVLETSKVGRSKIDTDADDKRQAIEGEIVRISAMIDELSLQRRSEYDNESAFKTGNSNVEKVGKLLQKKKALIGMRLSIRSETSAMQELQMSHAREKEIDRSDIIFSTLSASSTIISSAQQEHIILGNGNQNSSNASGGNSSNNLENDKMSSNQPSTSVKFKITACIVDEAAQAIELSSLIPLRLPVNRLVLVGDTKQLPATVISRSAASLGLSRSLFERLTLSGLRVVMLREQYRMVPAISSFPSKFFYDGMLINSSETRSRLPMYASLKFPSAFAPFRFFDVVSTSNGSRRNNNTAFAKGKGSYTSTEESNFIAQLLTRAKALDLLPPLKSISIISPYRMQTASIEIALRQAGVKQGEFPEVSTVDAFQGRESSLVIISTARCDFDSVQSQQKSRNGDFLMETPSPEIETSAAGGGKNDAIRTIGFVADVRRLNVAITRARDALWIVGSAATLATSAEWRELLQSCKKYANEHSLVDTVNHHVVASRNMGKKKTFSTSFDLLSASQQDVLKSSLRNVPVNDASLALIYECFENCDLRKMTLKNEKKNSNSSASDSCLQQLLALTNGDLKSQEKLYAEKYKSEEGNSKIQSSSPISRSGMQKDPAKNSTTPAKVIIRPVIPPSLTNSIKNTANRSNMSSKVDSHADDEIAKFAASKVDSNEGAQGFGGVKRKPAEDIRSGFQTDKEFRDTDEEDNADDNGNLDLEHNVKKRKLVNPPPSASNSSHLASNLDLGGLVGAFGASSGKKSKFQAVKPKVIIHNRK